jgi:ABC-2 type transport system permease protein
VKRFLSMYPTMLKVGFAGAIAYRAEFFVWMLTTNLPLVNLALWSAVAHDAPVQGWGRPDFTAYFLATLVVRLLTGCWVVWEMTYEIREGTIGLRMLRPVHPLLAYSADNLAAMPLRMVLCLPVFGVLLATSWATHLSHDAAMWALGGLMVLLAWTMTFLVMCLVGTLAFVFQSAASLYDLWLGLYTVFSGYLVPVSLFPPWMQGAVKWLPFRLLLGLPVETLLGRLTRVEALEGVGLQLAWCAGLGVAVHFAWRAGTRRFAAFGG